MEENRNLAGEATVELPFVYVEKLIRESEKHHYDMLIHEVERLRYEAEVLRTEIAELKQWKNELERKLEKKHWNLDESAYKPITVTREKSEENEESNEESEESEESNKESEDKPKRSTKRVNLDMGKVFALKKAGWSNKQIAEEMRVSLPTLLRRLKGEANNEEHVDGLE